MPVKCEVCGKEFKNRAGLAGHMNIIHGEKTNKPAPGSDRQESIRAKGTVGCQHIWKKLTPEQLRMVDESGSSVQDQGYKYYCAESGDLK